MLLNTEEVKSLIETGKTDKALFVLKKQLEKSPNDHINEVLLIKARFSELSSKYRMGFLNYIEYNEFLNKINFDILNLIDTLEENFLNDHIEDFDHLREIIKSLNQKIASHHSLRFLPQLFPGAPNLPLTSLYVELGVSTFANKFSNTLLSSSSLLQDLKLHQLKREKKFQRSVDEIIRESNFKRFIITGDPGSGKSSLLKYMGLQVANRTWEKWDLALFIEIRLITNLIKQNNLDWSFEEILKLSLSPYLNDTTLALLSKYLLNSGKHSFKTLLLFDGLDEIISDLDNYHRFCSILNNIPPHFSWIVSSRLTGLKAQIFEDQRLGITPLDTYGKEALINNWFDHFDEEEGKIKSKLLIRHIAKNPRLNGMARNPFLLSALCFLRWIMPTKEILPLTRAEVYAELVKKVAEQAQLVYSNPGILNQQTIEALEKFSFWLYTFNEEKVYQIFGKSHWESFSVDNKFSIKIEENILPARLLTKSSSVLEEYHFLHLSLQEFFIAKALFVKKNFKEVQEYRFKPAWRSIFPFLGTLLINSGQFSKFKTFIKIIAEPLDEARLSLVEAALIFREANIKNTREFLNYDLVEYLWESWEQGENILSSTIAKAISQMPLEAIQPYLDQAIKDLEKRLGQFSENEWRNYQEYQLKNPYLIYANRDDGISETWLLDQLKKEQNERLLYFIADAIGETLSRNGRQEILELAHIHWEERKEIFIEIFLKALHPDFVPFIGKVLSPLKVNEKPYINLVYILKATKGKNSLKLLQREFLKCLDEYAKTQPKERNLVSGIQVGKFMGNISPYGTSTFFKQLERQLPEKQLDIFYSILLNLDTFHPRTVGVLMNTLNKPNFSREAFGNEENFNDALSIMLDYMNHNQSSAYIISKEELIEIKGALEKKTKANFILSKLIKIDIFRIQQREEPAFLDWAKSRISLLFSMEHKALSPSAEEDIFPPYRDDIDGIMRMFEYELPLNDEREYMGDYLIYLALNQEESILESLFNILQDTKNTWSTTIQFESLTALKILGENLALQADAKKKIALKLLEFYKSNKNALIEYLKDATLWAIGHWNIKVLFHLKSEGDSNALKSLQRFSTEYGYLFYEKYFVDPLGNIHKGFSY